MNTIVKLNFAQNNMFTGLSRPMLFIAKYEHDKSQVHVMLDLFFLKRLQMSFSINRFSQGQQLVTKLVTAPVACGAVMVPSTMFMGQVVTAYPTFAAQQQQPQTLSITQQQQQQQQSQQDHQQQLTTVQQPAQPQLTQHPQQFLQVMQHSLQIFRSPDTFSIASLS